MTTPDEVVAEAMELADSMAGAAMFQSPRMDATRNALEAFLRSRLEEMEKKLAFYMDYAAALEHSKPSAAPAEPTKLKGRAAIIEAWNNLDRALRQSIELHALYQAIQQCEDASSAPVASEEREALNYLGLIARGPQHPGYISGIPDRIWASFGQEVCDEAQRIVASLPPAAPPAAYERYCDALNRACEAENALREARAELAAQPQADPAPAPTYAHPFLEWAAARKDAQAEPTAQEMPLLPEGADEVRVTWRGETEFLRAEDDYYTRDQMLAYGRLCMEKGQK